MKNCTVNMNVRDLFNVCIDTYFDFSPSYCEWEVCIKCKHATACDMVIIAKNMILEGGLMI